MHSWRTDPRRGLAARIRDKRIRPKTHVSGNSVREMGPGEFTGYTPYPNLRRGSSAETDGRNQMHVGTCDLP
jgi:hypothetical protein